MAQTDYGHVSGESTVPSEHGMKTFNTEEVLRAHLGDSAYEELIRNSPNPPSNTEEVLRAHLGDSAYEELMRKSSNPPRLTKDFVAWLRRYGGGSVERARHVLAWAKTLSDEEGAAFWEVVVEQWSGFDLIPHEEFSVEFLRFLRSAPRCDIRGSITLYRGQDLDEALGLSWTACKKTAAEFARGHRGIYNEAPAVFTVTALPEQIAFTCHNREEAEHVLFRIPEPESVALHSIVE